MISNLMNEIPLPPKGKVRLKLQVGTKSVFCSRPALNQFSMADVSNYLFISM